MPNKLTDNFLLQTGQPLDARYLTGALAAYADVAAANAAVPVALRHVGLKVLIGTAEYWWSGGVANENLVAVSTGGAGAGDVVGPASSTDNAIALFDGINGELLQDSPLTFASGTLTSSDAGLTLQANAGTSGRILLTATAAGFLSPDNTDEIGVANGTITIATNILGSGGSLTLTDAGMQLGGSGARVTTILNTAAGDSSSETAGVTAGWVKTFGVPDGDKGDITVSAGGATWTIDAQAVTFAKMQNIDGQSLIGRHASGTGVPQSVSVGNGIEFSGSGIRRSALTGDVTAAAGSNTTTIANNAVTFAKMADLSDESKLIGRGQGAFAGDPQEISLGANLVMTGASLSVDAFEANEFSKIVLRGATGAIFVTSITATGGQSTLSDVVSTTLSANNGTLTASAPVLNLAQTWDNAAESFTAIQLDVDNIASNLALSKLLNFNVNGSSAFSIYRSTNTGFAGALMFEFGSSGVASRMRVRTGGGVGVNFDGILGVGNTLQLGVSSGTSSGDVSLVRDAADTLDQRRSTNPQTFRLYNSHTSATNFERLNFRWSSNEMIIDAEAGSAGGTLRGIKLGSASTSLIGFFGATPVTQRAAISDATDAATTQARLNDLLAAMRSLGLIAT